MNTMMMLGWAMMGPATVKVLELGASTMAKSTIPYICDFLAVCPIDSFEALAVYSVAFALILVWPVAVLNTLFIIWEFKTARYFLDVPQETPRSLGAAPIRVLATNLNQSTELDEEKQVKDLLRSEFSYYGPRELGGSGPNLGHYHGKLHVQWKARALGLWPEPAVCVPGPLVIPVEIASIEVELPSFTVVRPAYQKSQLKREAGVSRLASWSIVAADYTVNDTTEFDTPSISTNQHNPLLLSPEVTWTEDDDFLDQSLDFGQPTPAIAAQIDSVASIIDEHESLQTEDVAGDKNQDDSPLVTGGNCFDQENTTPSEPEAIASDPLVIFVDTTVEIDDPVYTIVKPAFQHKRTTMVSPLGVISIVAASFESIDTNNSPSDEFTTDGDDDAMDEVDYSAYTRDSIEYSFDATFVEALAMPIVHISPVPLIISAVIEIEEPTHTIIRPAFQKKRTAAVSPLGATSIVPAIYDATDNSPNDLPSGGSIGAIDDILEDVDCGADNILSWSLPSAEDIDLYDEDVSFEFSTTPEGASALTDESDEDAFEAVTPEMSDCMLNEDMWDVNGDVMVGVSGQDC
ncbi:hypothetical protein FRB93_006849 [Tulasnella sp. JGI-2019a]|nr:hypothetical protein FRB93_006849 [Tulasnella sp. JGI-2019a]